MEHVAQTTVIRSATPIAPFTLVHVARYVGLLVAENYLTRNSNTAGAVTLLIIAELGAFPAARAHLLHLLNLVLLLDRMECVVL
jgi:hypothetical protein